MSQENVEIVREIFARLRRSESVLDVLSPAVVWEARMGPEKASTTG
jgi:hypothetical protein